MSEEAIYRLAEAAGLSRHWRDAAGRPQQVMPETLRKILEKLGLPCGDEGQCRDSEASLKTSVDGNRLPPLLTGSTAQALTLPANSLLSGQRYRIELEEGGQIEGTFSQDHHSFALPPIRESGYHRLLVNERETLLAIAPPRCYGVSDALRMTAGDGAASADARLWGLGVQLYSLRRNGDGGIGDFTALEQTARRLAERGAAAVAISPVHAMFSADVHRFSPYGPSSRLFINALHIDPAKVLGEEAYLGVIAQLGVAEHLAALESHDLIDWPAAATLRLALLRALYDVFMQNGTMQSEFEAFRKMSGEALRDHARFEALHALRLRQGESAYWAEWPAGLRDPNGVGVAQFARDHAHEIEFHEFLQWQAARGLQNAQGAACKAGMPIGVITDLAVGADNGGSQAWSRQREIINGLSVGAPPDAMNPRGQAWGLGAFSPQAMKAEGFRAYTEMLRSAFAYAGGVRIDHVLGLKRLWLVPDGESPENGAYLSYPMEDLMRLIALESWRHRAIVIGEDLGTVPEGFSNHLSDAGLLGIRVLLFQRHGERFMQPRDWPDGAIATTTTHDLPTLAGWWEGRDLELRNELDLLEKGQTIDDARRTREKEREALWQALAESGHAQGSMPEKRADRAPLEEAIAFMSASPAPLAMLPAEDALGLAEQPNMPGTVHEHPNWRRRLPVTVNTLFDEPAVNRRLDILNQSRCHNKEA
ncbi:MAG: malQ [Paucimonas sp.]|nr:malQ [Paucimonas sp.]